MEFATYQGRFIQYAFRNNYMFGGYSMSLPHVKVRGKNLGLSTE